MPAKFTRKAKYYMLLLLMAAVVLMLAGIGWYRDQQGEKNEYYTIGIIVNTVEITPDDMVFFKSLIGKQLEAINRNGGIGGRNVKALYLNDEGDYKRLKQLVQNTVQDKNLIAYIGCNTSSQAKVIVDLIGQEKVPLIGGFTLTQLINKYPNVYTSEVDITEQALILTNLLKEKGTKAAFIGKRGDLYSEALLKVAEDLAAQDPGFTVTFRKWYPFGYKFTQAEIRTLADSLKQQADFLVLSVDPEPTGLLINGLWQRGLKMPIFCGLADMSQLGIHGPEYRDGELYDLNAYGIPDALNMRLEEHMAETGKQFQQLSAFEFRISFAGRHVDEIGLIKEASLDRSLPLSAGIRARINAGLSKYINGRKIFRGIFTDWYFTPERSLARGTLLSWKPRDFPLPLLAPLQYLRTDAGIQNTPQLPVLYGDLNMVEFSEVNDQAGTFNATFYLEMYSARNLTLDEVDFANAARNKINQKPMVEVKLLRSKKDSLDRVYNNYLYKVSGKFMFEPDLKRYPFDEQRFPIIIQPKNVLQPFLVQPPDEDIRDSVFESSGWIYRNNFGGYTQDIVTSTNSFSSLQRNIPTYKFSYVYEMRRARVDFTLKTLVPLLAILLITYLSVYIPPKEFEALCGIQVTGLLAAIALYFSTYKPEMQFATISDKIFIFTYIMITSLIGTSIYLYVRNQRPTFLSGLTRIYQRIIFPLIVIVFTALIKY
jgi:hypothetical protein